MFQLGEFRTIDRSRASKTGMTVQSPTMSAGKVASQTIGSNAGARIMGETVGQTAQVLNVSTGTLDGGLLPVTASVTTKLTIANGLTFTSAETFRR